MTEGENSTLTTTASEESNITCREANITGEANITAAGNITLPKAWRSRHAEAVHTRAG